MNIVLRTVCGCERILDIPFTELPPTFSVPFIRHKGLHITAADGESCMTNFKDRRVFERTGLTGMYGYALYVEALE